eukprot:TRINITY_DN20909_c0_g1_i1.p1 TRINITY_DN20909_c0_g1~~TRINITY_DN20909_c0_g1_i1.p1  ORF type:complete len:138 (+),score=31.45 TRINITY_DN20909_c0_g1_i1:23-415(+)
MGEESERESNRDMASRAALPIVRRALVAAKPQRAAMTIVRAMSNAPASVNSGDNFASEPVSEHGPHRSDAMARIHKVPPIDVEDTVAVCTGGSGALGHPTEFIQLNKSTGNVPETCKYCGLQYVMKHHHH